MSKRFWFSGKSEPFNLRFVTSSHELLPEFGVWKGAKACYSLWDAGFNAI